GNPGNLTLKADGNITISDNVYLGDRTLTLVAGRTITQNRGTITAGVLTGSSNGSTDLGTPEAPIYNHFDIVDAFWAGADFSLTNAQTLTVRGVDSQKLGIPTAVIAGANGGLGAGATGNLSIRVLEKQQIILAATVPPSAISALATDNPGAIVITGDVQADG